MDNLVEAPAVGPVRPGGRDYGSPSSARPSRTIGHGRIETVAIASLILTDTPRTSGTDPEHVLRLAEVKEGLPPILVQRSTLRVIDGMHRVKAAMLRGDDTIPVQYFEGSDAESFVQSVQANVAHGLPLSADEREAATERIVRIYPDWSDRAIAAVAGLSPPTVAGIRRRSTEKSSQLNRRVGRDGRRRPVDGAPGRKKAVDIMRERPEAPLRAVAQRKKGAPVPSGETTSGAAPQPAKAQQTQRQLLSSLRQDPSVRMTEKGRLLLQWLGILTLDAKELQQFADSTPAHQLLSMAQLAQDCSATWRQLATELHRAVRRGP
ncbi:ParB/RepB/Spo0J family partition protein [Streptomyces sp. NRRL WC-3702]|uniref:ParB/RepB/Spo0J family partition protein n=1 Tax=Streptomyces sp. NRRL WC-3702 TaxID=1463929 RepID=UPI0009962326|nr:ParB N-terminal domain-containing protein [Streptomyces sp. NRRL WC-3702]